ncbi:MAG: YceI family protein [Pseudobdellovibrionaceae bacterium]|jgi:polyisoprenoid-binding protein YceI|nr:YceI family protein [Pseudobdellovibrionaceae bacterium]
MIRSAFAFGTILFFSSFPVHAADWEINKDKSSITFHASYEKDTVTGQVGAFDSEITFDPNNLSTSNALVTFDMSSVLTGDMLYDSPLPSAEWLNIKDFPLSAFQSTSFEKTQDGYLVSGDFTLLGVTKPVKIPFTFLSDGETAQVSGLFSFNRSAFGLGEKSPDSTSLSDEIRVEISLAAKVK